MIRRCYGMVFRHLRDAGRAAGVFLIVGGGAAAAESSEDAYRRMLEGGATKPAEQAPKAETAPRPRPARPAAPPTPKIACDQKFAELKAKSDAGGEYYKKWCFIEERCTQQEKCNYSRRSHVEYAALAKIASQCPALANAQDWAARYAKFASKAPELNAYFCRFEKSQ